MKAVNARVCVLGLALVAGVRTWAAPMNAALGKSASALTTLSNDPRYIPRGNDGNTNGFWSQNSVYHSDLIWNATNHWWQVDLGITVPLTNVTIYNRATNEYGGRLRDITLTVYDRFSNLVYVSPVLNPSNQTYGGVNAYQIGGPAVLIHDFPNPVTGRTVRITRNRDYYSSYTGPAHDRYLLQFAEAQVWADDVAVGKTATQSSTDTNWPGGYASHGVDGNTGGRYSDGSVTHTLSDDENPWWRVDLGPAEIHGVVIHNRQDLNPGRLRDITVKILGPDTSTVVLSSGLLNSNNLNYGGATAWATGPSNLTFDVHEAIGTYAVGRFVEVRRQARCPYAQNQADSNVLSMAEVEVYGRLYVPPPTKGTLLILR